MNSKYDWWYYGWFGTLVKTIIWIVGITGVILFLFFGFCSNSNFDYVREHARKTLSDNGFEIIGYQGYQWGGQRFLSPVYGGSVVWYTVTHKDSPGIIYDLALQRQDEETIGIYSIKALNAVSNRR